MAKDGAQYMKRDVLASTSTVLTTTANSTMDSDDMDGDEPTEIKLEDLVSFQERISEHIKLEEPELDVDTNIQLENNSVYEHEPLYERSRAYFHELAVLLMTL